MANLENPCRATEMDVTMIGLQNAGKSSLLRVLAVCPLLSFPLLSFSPVVCCCCCCPTFTVAVAVAVPSLTDSRRVGNSLSSKLIVQAYEYPSVSNPIAFLRSRSRGDSSIPTIGFNTKRVQKGHVTLKWYPPSPSLPLAAPTGLSVVSNPAQLGSGRPTSLSPHVGAILSGRQRHRVS